MRCQTLFAGAVFPASGGAYAFGMLNVFAHALCVQWAPVRHGRPERGRFATAAAFIVRQRLGYALQLDMDIVVHHCCCSFQAPITGAVDIVLADYVIAGMATLFILFGRPVGVSGLPLQAPQLAH